MQDFFLPKIARNKDRNIDPRQVRATGIESSGEVPPKAVVTVHYSFYVELDDHPFDSTRIRGRPGCAKRS
jgi:hypothetical protein